MHILVSSTYTRSGVSYSDFDPAAVRLKKLSVGVKETQNIIKKISITLFTCMDDIGCTSVTCVLEGPKVKEQVSQIQQ
jgi:hypothetical protein